MSKYSFFTTICLIAFILILQGCEKNAIQNPTKDVGNDDLVSTRSIDCGDYNCNDDDCCCGVWLQNIFSTARLDLCNTTDGTATCPAGGGGGGVLWCPTFSAVGGQSIYLHSGNTREGFCVEEGTTFSITNTGSANAQIYLTCQNDLTNPQILTITIAPNSTYELVTSSACELSDCYY